MALIDIVAQEGDGQGFILEIPEGNTSYTPNDILIEPDGNIQCSEIPEIIANEGGGNIFIMSE